MATFNGTEGNDTLIGGADNDLINGNGGSDFLQGGGGLDTVVGGAGNDTLGGNEGVDWLRGGVGNDTVAGGSGQDEFAFADFGATNADLLTDFDAGWDHIQLNSAAFTNIGATGRFSSGDVRFYSAPGATAAHDADDRIIYNSTTGQLYYDADGNGAAPAELIATIQNHSALGPTDIFVYNDPSQVPTPSPTPTPTPGAINGTSGNDTIIGTAGPDTINGLGGDDSIRGIEGADSMSGGDGNDTLDGWNSRTFDSDIDVDTMDGGLGNDTFMVDNVNDVLTDAGGIDSVISHDVDWTLGAGFENLQLRQDNDFAIHGTGNDLDNVISANWFSVLDGRGGNDTILGSPQNDTIFGGDGNDFIASDQDVDSVDGGAGDDTIDGGAFGDDDITGGTGADHFVLAGPGELPNRIHDFTGGVDKIRLDGNRFADVGPSGNFTAGDERFYAAPGASSAHDATDRVIYNTATGELFYDADGTGTGTTASRIGIFPGLSATDIEVVNGTTPSPTPSPTPTPTPIPAGSIVGTSGNDNLSGTNGNDSIFGLAGNDTIFANSGDDWVQGGAGNDSVSGGSGQDRYAFAESGAANADQILNFGSGWDSLHFDAAGFGAIGATGRFSAGDVRFFAASGATGGHDADDRIVYNTSTGQLFYDADGSGAGSAQLIATLQGAPGMAATDINVFGTATPSPSPSPTPTPSNTPTAGNDLIVGTSGNDSLVGLAGNDTLVGLEGNDTLDGGTGVDSMDGGAGDDLYFVDDSSDTIFEAENDGIDEVRSTADFYQLSPWVNNLTLIGTANTLGFGNDIENVLTGNAGNNQFNGAGGNDTINGGAGNDTIFGVMGDDVLNGGTGNDYLEGEDGTDTYVFDVAPGAANADTVGGFASGEHIVLDGNAFTNIGASGNFAVGDARFYAASGATQGHDADDRIILDTSTGNVYYDADGSGAGGSQLFATLITTINIPPQPGFAQASDFVVVNGSPTPTPTPTPGQAINGTEGNDSLVGTAGNDTINGLGGNDTIDGAAGADSMIGGNGDDTYFVDDTRDTIVETENGGIDDVRSTVDYTLSAWVNDLTLVDGFTGAGNDIENRITGNALNNNLYGLAGADTLIGGAGNDALYGGNGDIAADSMLGGDGNDTLDGTGMGGHEELAVDTMDGGLGDDLYYVDNAGDVLVDAGGTDTVFVWNMGWTLGAGFERLIINNQYLESGVTGIGNSLDNYMELQWNGRLEGGAGNDTLVAAISGDALLGGAGNDSIVGGGPWTSAGHNTIDGGAGNDTLTGTDPSSFYFTAAPGAANADVVTDFTSGTDDLVLDGTAMSALGSSGRFSAGDVRFYSSAGATGGHDADDRVVYNTSTGQLFYDADGAGAGTAQLIATLQGAPGLAASDISVTNGASPTPTPTPGTSLNGTSGDDTLVGTSGNDTIFGNSGNDWIEGRGGNDQLSGGSGQDSYVFREFGSANADTLLNFDSNWDAMRFDSGAFTALGGAGHFAAGDARFYAAAGASGGHDADDRIVYNTSTGALYYDADGAGGADAQLVATIQGATPVTASDIWVI